jgi:hypothetical protein
VTEKPALLHHFAAPVTVADVKDAYEAVRLQPHHNPDPGPDPFQGQGEEHDRLTAAFTELHHLDQRVRAEAAALFERHGLGGHGFGAGVLFYHDPDRDKTRTPTPQNLLPRGT